MRLFGVLLTCWKLFGLFVARSEVTWLFSCLLVLFGNLLGSFVAPGEADLVSSCWVEFV